MNNGDKKMNVPRIRFKGFDGGWKITSFLNIAERISILANYRNLPCIEYEDIISGENALNKDIFTKHTHKKGIAFSANDILFGKLRPYLLNIYLPEFSGIAVGDFWVLRSVSVLPRFLLFLIFTPRFMRVANISCGSKMPRSDWALVSESEFLVPSHDEQQSIAQYFSSLDSLIKATEKKIASFRQVKEASLQAMFPAEGETVPKVRFKGFEGEWKKEKLSKYAKRITRKNSNLETTLPITISSENGIVSQTSFFNNVVASSNLRGYYLIKRGEFAYNKSYSNGYPWGSVKRLDKYKMGALSTLYIVFELDAFISHEYAISFFETNLWHKEVAMRAAEGARNHGLLNISADDFLDINILVPTEIAEQRKIASYFTNLDKQIAIQTQRLEKLKQIKSACLDVMFV